MMRNFFEKLLIILLYYIEKVLFSLQIYFFGPESLARDLRRTYTEEWNQKFIDKYKGITGRIAKSSPDHVIDTKNPENETPVYISNFLDTDEIVDEPENDNFTLHHFFPHQIEKGFGERQVFGFRKIEKYVTSVSKSQDTGLDVVASIPHFGPIQYLNHNQAFARIKCLSRGISEITGMKPGDKLCIDENSSLEWMLMAQACFRRQYTIVTVYATMGFESVCFSLNESKIETIFMNESKLDTEIVELKKIVPTLKTVIYAKMSRTVKQEEDAQFQEVINKQIKEFELERQKKIEELELITGCKIISFDEVERLGKLLLEKKNGNEELVLDDKLFKRDATAVVMYTSGTSGMSKGVLTTHRMIFSAMQGVSLVIGILGNTQNDTYLGYLPLAHTLELMCEHFFIQEGATICYGSSKTLADKFSRPMGDFAAYSPSCVMGVPRVFETLKKGILSIVHSKSTPKYKAFLFNIAFEVKKRALRAGFSTPLMNVLVFKSIKKSLGGKVQYCFNGGAPCAIETQEFIRIVFDCAFVSGYGLTETSSTGSIQDSWERFTPENVSNTGNIDANCYLKLRSSPETGHFVTDKPLPRGEILIAGPSVSPSYYNTELNKGAFLDDKSGMKWFCTGDIAQINPNNSITIIDRRKNLIKLSFGEYISLEKVEAAYMTSPFVSPNGIMVHGDPTRSFLIAFIVPDRSYLRRWIEKYGFKDAKFNELLEQELVIEAVKKSLEVQEKKAKLNSAEKIKKFLLVGEEWTPENGLLTAAQKLARSKIAKFYEKQIQEIYQQE